MPVTGRKPKPAGESRNRTSQMHDWTEVENVPFKGGPDLPDPRSDDRRWPERTKKKWDAWRAMPHAKLWGRLSGNSSWWWTPTTSGTGRSRS